MNWRSSLPKTITLSGFEMRRALHILTRTDDPLAQEVIPRLREQSDEHLKVVDLNAANPDYASLVEEIFAADSVAVW